MNSASRESKVTVIKAILVFATTLALYFLTRSPGLDEIDSVNFAMGVRQFNLWNHQPHPPGYPLFVFAGWIGATLFKLSPEISLHLAAAIGGALLVSAWFLIVRLQFNERLAWWVSISLAITPVIWMTATKVLSDTLAAGLLSTQILFALYFIRSGKSGNLIATSLLGAASAGVRPQLFLVVLTVLITALLWRRPPRKMSILGVAMLLGGCLLWLVPMWYLQWRIHSDTSIGGVYPHLVYKFWAGRLDKPSMYLFAGDWSPRYLATRFAFHFLGWFGLGFGFLESWPACIAGTVIVCPGLAAYFFQKRDTSDVSFWKFHVPWALVHIAAIFIALPPTQRYYVVIFPLLLVPILRGFLRLPRPWTWIAASMPAFLLFVSVPIAIDNHCEDAPPVRFVRYIEKLCPPEKRSRIVLLLSTKTKRHAEWYDPAFVTINPIPPAEGLPELTKNAIAVYTDDDGFALPKGWRRVPLAEFDRSWVIYMKAHILRLFLVVRDGNG